MHIEGPDPTTGNYNLRNREVFAVGTWNGEKVTEKDLDDIVTAFGQVGYTPPLKLGHTTDPGAPAVGWIKNLRREGAKLVADFEDIPGKVFEALRQKMYNAVSAEVFYNLDRGGKTFRRALKAVALLGAVVPGVSNLKPLSEVFANITGEEKAFTYQPNEENNVEKDEEIKKLKEQIAALEGSTKNFAQTQAQLVEAQKQLTELQKTAREERIKGKVASLRVPAFRPFAQALLEAVAGMTEVKEFSTDGGKTKKSLTPEQVVDEMIGAINTHSEKLFKELAVEKHDRPAGAADDYTDPSAEVDRRTRDYCEKNKVDYTVGYKQVLRDDPELAKRYNQLSQ